MKRLLFVMLVLTVMFHPGVCGASARQTLEEDAASPASRLRPLLSVNSRWEGGPGGSYLAVDIPGEEDDVRDGNPEPVITEEPAAGWQFSDALDRQFKALLFLEWTDPSDIPGNPGNTFLKIPEAGAQFHLRPDFRLNFETVTCQVKPRMTAGWSHWAGGLDRSDQEEIDVFMNEWSIRASLTDWFFLILGRENLQWGPGYLGSLSNPFFSDNGKTNPQQEVPGMDFIRLVFMPDPLWTISTIANIGKGAADIPSDEFHSRYALKLDYCGTASYAGLVLSCQESPGAFEMGCYAGITASDALILYTEGMSSHHDTALLYPATAPNPVGKGFESRDYGLLEHGSFLLGGSYTTEAGPTVVLEYLFSGYGYTGAQASSYFEAIDIASSAYSIDGASRLLADYQSRLSGIPVPVNAPSLEKGAPSVQGLSTAVLGQAMKAGEPFLRRNYLMAQVHDSDVREIIDYTVRYTHCLDDQSGQALLLLDIKATESTHVFSVFKTQFGRTHSDFGSGILDYYWMFGIQYDY
ncbi:MAG: hypothetical protein V1793_25425 [Pseudomonadota bacterium]